MGTFYPETQAAKQNRGYTMTFTESKWIRVPETRQNHFMLFTTCVQVPDRVSVMRMIITASYHYELYINGSFINRGPVHGDPNWCNYDELTYIIDPDDAELHISIVVRHSSDIYLHYLTPAPAGLRAECTLGTITIKTDTSWRCMTLPMWEDDVLERGWALDYAENYDARLEPGGWSGKIFPSTDTAPWMQAAVVKDADTIWNNYQKRQIPLIRRRFREPVAALAWKASETCAEKAEDIPSVTDTETLTPAGTLECFSVDGINSLLKQANAFTCEFDNEKTGFPFIDLEAPEGTVIEISAAEEKRDGRPLTDRKHWHSSVRYTAGSGRRSFQPFAWDGFRYMHIVIRGTTDGIRFHRIGCTERNVPLVPGHTVSISDPLVKKIFSVCIHTLEISPQEHLVDCPTREQSPAWADSLHVAKSLWKGFGERGYMHWYLEAYIRAPLDEHGQISGRYPTTGRIWLDFTLIPLLGQAFFLKETGRFYKPDETIKKALQLKEWYDRHLNSDGLLEFPFREYFNKGLRNFIDHPGLNDNDAFPHPGIDREGISCGLNTFYCGFVHILACMAAHRGHSSAEALKQEALHLRKIIPETFYDGRLFHDALNGTKLSDGTSWQTNGLAVYYGLANRDRSASIMKNMIDGYESLCRCTPYFHFYFLWALRRAGMENEAVAIIKKEWGPMIRKDTTATWECFHGGVSLSRCHPWSTAPFLFLIDREEFSLPPL